ncbi:hypothetical protein ACUNIZ_08820 [Serratia sp. IR-2025]
MDKFSELKAAAEKSWEIGGIKNYKKGDAAIAAFKAAATPAAILALLAELEAKDEVLRAIAFHVSAGGYNAGSVDAEVFKQKIIDGINSISDVQIKRIAELEAIRVNASQVFKEIGTELGCNPDNESIMAAIDELKERENRVVALAGGNAELWETMAARLEAAESKLATSVDINLPERRDDSYDWDGASPSEAFNTCRSICGLMFRQQLRAVGVKVEGDE